MDSKLVILVVTNTTIPFCHGYLTLQGSNHTARGRRSYYGRPIGQATIDFLRTLTGIPMVERAFVDEPNRTSVWISPFNLNWNKVNDTVLRLLFADLGIEFDPERVDYYTGTTQELLVRGYTRMSYAPTGGPCGDY